MSGGMVRFSCFHCHRKLWVQPKSLKRSAARERLLEFGWTKLGRSEYACPNCPERKP